MAIILNKCLCGGNPIFIEKDSTFNGALEISFEYIACDKCLMMTRPVPSIEIQVESWQRVTMQK